MFICFARIGFQAPATPIMEGIVDLHNYIFFYLIIVFVFVLWMFIHIIFIYYTVPTIILETIQHDDTEEYYEIFDVNMQKLFWQTISVSTYDFNVVPVNEEYSLRNHVMFSFFNYLHKCLSYMPKKIHLRTLRTRHFTESIFLEIIWTIIPSLILGAIVMPSFALLYAMDEIIDPKLTVKVIGYQWFWVYEYAQTYSKETFNYLTDYLGYNYTIVKKDITYESVLPRGSQMEEGKHRLLDVDKKMILPINTHIRILVTATDVLHSWAVPSLGVKIDAVPGRLNQVSIYIKRQGVFYGQCSELCGVNHGFMPIAVKAVSYKEFLKWYEKIIPTWHA